MGKSKCYPSVATRLRRSHPYLQTLHRGIKNSKDLIEILRRFPSFVIQDIVEILYNMVHKRCHITPKQKAMLFKHKASVNKLLSDAKRYKRNPKHILKRQKGGFLPLLIPVALSLISNLLPN